MKALAIALTLSVPLGIAASASTVLDTVDAQLYRNEAMLYPEVGTASGGFQTGSGVLISSRWVLTAGHVADFKTGGTYTIGGVNYTIARYLSPPGRPPFSTTIEDLGLLELTSDVTNIQAATMWRPDNVNELLGREATWVGFGFGGTGLTGFQGSPEKRAFTNVIDGFTPRAGLPQPSFFSDFDNPDGTSNSLTSGSPTPTRLEGNLTPGDSGGGVFVYVNGERYLVGINAYMSGFTPDLNGRYGALSGATNLFNFHDWIFQETGIAAVPEPATIWLCVMGGLLGFVRRR